MRSSPLAALAALWLMGLAAGSGAGAEPQPDCKRPDASDTSLESQQQPVMAKFDKLHRLWLELMLVNVDLNSTNPLKGSKNDHDQAFKLYDRQVFYRSEHLRDSMFIHSSYGPINRSRLGPEGFMLFHTKIIPQYQRTITFNYPIGLLMALETFVDCSLPCAAIPAADNTTLEYQTQARIHNIALDGLRSVQVLGQRLVLEYATEQFRDNSSSQKCPNSNKNNCDLCQQIELLRSYDPNSLATRWAHWYQWFQGWFAWFYSLLKPMHWLILLLSTWLGSCLIIGMRIQRRDRRRLRRHLLGRTDYSFSTRR